MPKPKTCPLKLHFSVNHSQRVLYLISIFLSLVHIENGACVIPEASQEGPLRSFKSYQDIVMLHFHVPRQVLRATWQFSAFTDNSQCPKRKVHIFLKWGSYPVISVDNSKYPPGMFIQQNDTVQVSTETAYEPKSMTIVPVYSPLPGDWFVGAYLSPWDEKIHQKGLGHECHYSLGSVAIWSEISNIQSIPLDYQKTIMTTETISYYKIYIPMEAWNFQVDIWGCNFTLKKTQNFNIPCIEHLAFKSRALPYYNHSNSDPTVNLTVIDTYTFSETKPFQNSWYYLMIVSKTVISFNIKVTVSDCPVKTLEETLIRQRLNAPISSKISDQLQLEHLNESSVSQWYSIINKNEAYESSFISKKQPNYMENDNTPDICMTRYQLVRIKYPQVFSAEYLFQSREWLTSWLALTDTYPTITQFDVLPLIDIGGTLDISMSLEVDKILIRQQVEVSICIDRGRIPKHTDGHIRCSSEEIMMRLSSTDKNNTSFLIPYPQPDTWYISFQTSCYVNKMPAPCEMEQILVSLNIKLRACVFEGDSCGPYGVCQEIRKGMLFFSACKCFGGRRGWGCTDASDVASDFSILFNTLALTLSNLSFLPAVYLAFRRQLFTEGLVYLSTMLFSALYHTCDQQSTNYCIAKFEVLQYCDFFLGILAFWITLVSMADISVQYESFHHMLGVIIITFTVESDKTGLTSSLIPLAIGASIPLSSYAYNCIKMKKVLWPQRMTKLLIGLSLVGFGMILFSVVETESNYQYVHSAWHMIIAIALVFLLPMEKEEQNMSCNSNSELLDSKESPDDSVCNIDDALRSEHLIDDVR